MRSSYEPLDGKHLVVEHGPVGWHGPSPETDAACEALGLKPIESEAADSHRYLVDRDQLLPLPQSIAGVAASPLLTVREKMRAAAEKWADFAPDGKEETVHEFITRRFGEGVATKIAAPVVRGLFADDARVVSMPALFPGVAAAEMNHGSLTKAGKHFPQIFGAKVKSLSEGVGQLAQRLAEELGDQYAPQVSVDTAVREQGWWFLFHEGQQIAVARKLALCLPVGELGVVLREYLPGGVEQVARFRGQDLAMVSLLYHADSVPDPCAGFGILPPADHTSPVLSVQFAHSIFPQHVPEGWVLLRGMLGAETMPGLLQASDDELIAALAGDLSNWLGAPARPQRAWVHRHPGGVPHYGLGYVQARAQLLEDLDKIPDLAVGCDALHGIGIEAALVRGAAIARKVSSTAD